MPSKYLCVHILYLWITPINMALLVKFYFQFPRQEVSVKSILGHFWKNWNETNSNPAELNSICLPSWWTMHLEVDQKYYLWQEEEDGLVLPVLDSLDNYKILSERMNVLTIYLPCRNWSSVLTSTQPESAVKKKLTCNFCQQCTQLKFALVPGSARNLRKSYRGILEKTLQTWSLFIA